MSKQIIDTKLYSNSDVINMAIGRGYKIRFPHNDNELQCLEIHLIRSWLLNTHNIYIHVGYRFSTKLWDSHCYSTRLNSRQYARIRSSVKENDEPVYSSDMNALKASIVTALSTITEGIITEDYLKSVGFKLVTIEFSPFVEFRKMPYYVKDAVLLFFNERKVVDQIYNQSFLIGYGSCEFGRYHAVTFRWIDKICELHKFFDTLSSTGILR